MSTSLLVSGWASVVSLSLTASVAKGDVNPVANESAEGNSSQNCSNKLCIQDDDYIDMIADFLAPDVYDWLFISVAILVFFGGIIGNVLVCFAVYRNRGMRTVTNYFIVNLAVADLMVIVFCLPPTVLWDVFETWFLGELLCKVIPYLQTVSVSVSILTLTIISIDRWYAICFPLEFKSTTGRAKKSIVFIWIFSFIFDIPDLTVLHVIPPSHLMIETVFYTQCGPSWSAGYEKSFTVLKLIFLYFGPLGFMTITYCRIFRVLWSGNIPGYKLSRNLPEISQMSGTNENLESQLVARKKAAKMLVVVVLIFGICYAPVHLLFFLRNFVGLPSNDFTVAYSLLAHLLCYVNSAINPVIYNFMSEKFRMEFKRSFICTRTRSSCERGQYQFASTLQRTELRSQNRLKRDQTFNNHITADEIKQSSEIVPLSKFENQSFKCV